MSLVHADANRFNETRYYEVPFFKKREDAMEVVQSIRGLPGFEADRVFFEDIVNRSGEGSQSARFSGEVSNGVVKEYIMTSCISSMGVGGTYKGAPVIVGADFDSARLYITLRKKKPADIEDLEKVLNLV